MSINDQTSAYRRGVLLGLTMAEIIMLIVFLLLLSFAALMTEQQKKLKLIESHKESIERILVILDSQEPDITKELISTIESLPAAIKQIKDNALINTQTSDVSQVITKAIDKMVIEKKIVESKGQGSIENQLVEASKKIEELQVDTKNLQDQKESLLQRLQNEGKGASWPSCWTDSNGRNEYIFKIDLASEGIAIVDNPIPARVEEKSRLPIQAIKYGTLRTVQEFLSETRPLFDWSVERKCRFFVMLYDKTGANEKVRFKELMRRVEEHFYKNLIDVPVPAQNEVQPTKPKKEESLFDSLWGTPEPIQKKKGGYN